MSVVGMRDYSPTALDHVRLFWEDLAAVIGSRSPIVVARRSTLRRRERNAFELGMEASGAGFQRPQAPAGRQRGLHVV